MIVNTSVQRSRYGDELTVQERTVISNLPVVFSVQKRTYDVCFFLLMRPYRWRHTRPQRHFGARTGRRREERKREDRTLSLAGNLVCRHSAVEKAFEWRIQKTGIRFARRASAFLQRTGKAFRRSSGVSGRGRLYVATPTLTWRLRARPIRPSNRHFRRSARARATAGRWGWFDPAPRSSLLRTQLVPPGAPPHPPRHPLHCSLGRRTP